MHKKYKPKDAVITHRTYSLKKKKLQKIADKEDRRLSYVVERALDKEIETNGD